MSKSENYIEFKIEKSPIGSRSGDFVNQYLRLRAASAFFLRFTLGFS